MPPYHNKEPASQICCQKGVRCGAIPKADWMGVYLAYIPIQADEGSAADDPLSQQRTKEPNLLSEAVRYGAKSKFGWMGVYLAYIPIRTNELGAADCGLSQQI